MKGGGLNEPWFWRETGLAAGLARGLLTPAAAAYDLAQRLRNATTNPYRPDIPVICIGNATLGGVGKTPFAIALKELLTPASGPIAFLTRGYGGAEQGPLVVSNNHNARDVGDEPLLLAQAGETIVAKNRPAGARLAAARDARLIIMDDGFQNPTIAKDVCVLLRAADAPPNTAVFPAGPYREPPARAAARADIAITIGTDARLEPKPVAADLKGRKVLGFCGIGRPERFAASLKQAGFDLADFVSFPDHHPFTDQEIAALHAKAKGLGAVLIATEKDFVRLPPSLRTDIAILPVAMHIDAGEALRARILTLLDERRPGWRDTV